MVVQSSGTFGNLILTGSQILLPTDISYIIERNHKLKMNTKISTGPTTTVFFSFFQSKTGLGDTHVNDAFDGIAAWAWTDNSMIPDKTNGILNVMVTVGKIRKNGKLKVRKPIQLTNFPVGLMAWDTAVAINRTNKKNIVV